MEPTPEMVKKHREIMESFPADEICACDPAYGRWCAFHADFDTDLGKGSRELLPDLAARALTLHEATKNFLAYPVKRNQELLSLAVGAVESDLRLYLHERQVDHEREMEMIREQRRGE